MKNSFCSKARFTFRREIFSAALILSFAINLALTGCAPKKTSDEQGPGSIDSQLSISASLSPASINFGELKKDDPSVAPKIFTLVNTGTNTSRQTLNVSLTSACQEMVSVYPARCDLAKGQSCAIYISPNTSKLGELNGCQLQVGSAKASILLKVSENPSSGPHLVINSSLSGEVYSSAAIHDVAVSLENDSGTLVDTASGLVTIDAIAGTANCDASAAALANSVGGVVNNTGDMKNGLASFGRVAYALKSTTSKANIRLRAHFASYVACTESFNVNPYDDTLKNAFGTNPKIQWKLASDSAWGLDTAPGKSEAKPMSIFQGNGIPSLNLRAVRSVGSSVEVIPTFLENEFLIVMGVQSKVNGVWTDNRDFYFYKTPKADFSIGNSFWSMEFGDYNSSGVLTTPSDAYTLKGPLSATLTNVCSLYRIVFRSVGGSVLENPENNDKLYIRACIPINYDPGSSQSTSGSIQLTF